MPCEVQGRKDGCMGFREVWLERQVQAAEELRCAVAQARENWQDRRVWVWADRPRYLGPGLPGWQYGEVASVDDEGLVQVLYDYTAQGQPVYCLVKVGDLGRLVRLAE